MLNYTSDKNLIHDIVQDSFMYLWTNKKKIKINTSLNSYLYRMTYNKLMDHFRKKSKVDADLMGYYKSIVDSIEETDSSLKEEKLTLLDKCIEDLPKRCKNVFYSKKIKGLKSKEIATDLNISVKTVEAHITKAYVLLRACLNPKTT